MNDFLTGVGQLKFRGTSLLLRSPVSVFALLKEQEMKAPPAADGGNLLRSRKRSRNVLPSEELDPSMYSFDTHDETEAQSFFNAPSNNGEIEYDFATHVIKVKRSGTVVDVSSLWDFEGIIILDYYHLLHSLTKILQQEQVQ